MSLYGLVVLSCVPVRSGCVCPVSLYGLVVCVLCPSTVWLCCPVSLYGLVVCVLCPCTVWLCVSCVPVRSGCLCPVSLYGLVVCVLCPSTVWLCCPVSLYGLVVCVLSPSTVWLCVSCVPVRSGCVCPMSLYGLVVCVLCPCTVWLSVSVAGAEPSNRDHRADGGRRLHAAGQLRTASEGEKVRTDDTNRRRLDHAHVRFVRYTRSLTTLQYVVCWVCCLRQCTLIRLTCL